MKYSKFVAGLIKSPFAIGEELSPAKINLWHMATGICGEAAEVFSAVMVDDLIKEMGDVEFYLEGFRQELGIKRRDTVFIQDRTPNPLIQLMCLSGKLLDEVKKHVVNGKVLNVERFKNLLLGIEICLFTVRDEIGPISRTEVITANMEKLKARYTKGEYSDQEAAAKADQISGV